MSTWEELGTTSTKILNDLPNLKKGHRQKTDGVTAKVTTREACASKNSNRKVYVPDKARVQKKRQNSLIPLVLTFNAELFVSNATSMQL